MGISRARKQGKQLGRPRVQVDPLQIAGLRTRGYSWNQIAETLGIGLPNGLSDRFPQKSLTLPATPARKR